MDQQGVLASGGARAARVKAGTARRVGQDPHHLGRLSSKVLVGRERDLELLLEAVINPPGLILVEGEAGVGKTRLVHEALSDPSVQSGRVLVGHCHQLREPFLLGPVLEALRSTDPPDSALSPVAGVLQPLLPELAHALPAEPAPTADPRAERHRIFRALRELIDAFGPTVCLLEDMHWAGEGTLEFLAFLLAEPPEALSIVLTYRSEDLHPSSSLVGLPSHLPRDALTLALELAPLSVEEVRALTCALLDAASVSEDIAESLYDRSAGLPFALEEIIRLLLDRGQLTLTEDGEAVGDLEPVGVPTVIGHSIRERMEPFSADARLITRAAAVLALPADETLLGRVAGLPPSGRRGGSSGRFRRLWWRRGKTAPMACAMPSRLRPSTTRFPPRRDDGCISAPGRLSSPPPNRPHPHSSPTTSGRRTVRSSGRATPRPQPMAP